MNAERRTEAQLMPTQIEAIRVSNTNPRQHFEDAGIDELAASIEQLGVQVPLLVRFARKPNGDLIPGEYELVSGERRLRAATKIGLNVVPCLVREMSDAEARETQITENLQRADVHPVEEAEAYRLLIADSSAHGLSSARTAGDIARRFGKNEAYVAKRLKLLDLEFDAKLMYAKGHLTLGHAELMARLTAKDQERALYFLLKADPKFDKRPLTEIIGGRLRMITEGFRKGERLVQATEAQLKDWVGFNVLLQLANVPWRLEDATLVPIAGGCDTCPKRSGSNVALFADLTAEEDICLDPVCFAAKQKATMVRQKETAKATGGHLVKISSKPSHEKMEEPAIVRRVLEPNGAGNGAAGESVTVTKKTVRAGQWVSAQDRSCADAIEALMVDGPNRGRMLKVCANQACKVHKHRVDKASPGGGPVGETWEKRQARETAERKVELEKQAEYEKVEIPVYQAVFDAIRSAVRAAEKLDWVEELRWMLMSYCEEQADTMQAALMLRVPFKGEEDDGLYGMRSNAADALIKHIKKADRHDLLQAALCLREHDALDVGEYSGENNRAQLWKMAKRYGVNADKVVKRMTMADSAITAAAPKPAVKAAAKKMTPEARRRKAQAAMKKRMTGAGSKGVKVGRAVTA